MSPIITGRCYVPTKSEASAMMAIEGRVLNYTPIATAPSRFTRRCVDEFVTRVMRGRERMHPVELDEVYERQNRPAQRYQNELGALVGRQPKSTVFIKTETYDQVKDPRIITTFNGSARPAFMRYIYVLADVLKEQPWYGFKQPVVVAERVAEVCSQAKRHALNVDSKRHDKHVDTVCRELEKLLFLAVFHEQHHAEILDLLAEQQDRVCIMDIDSRVWAPCYYDQKKKRGSGSGETSACNSVDTAMVQFMGWRMTTEGGVFVEADAAFERIGIVGGDDSLAVDLPESALHKAATALGLRLTVELVPCGERGVEFLARKFSPLVFQGDPSSMCDLPRTLRKFHAAPRLQGVTPLEKLRQRLSNLALTDANTPVIKDLLQTARLVGLNLNSANLATPLKSWWAQYDKSVQWPNNNTGMWMESETTILMPEFAFDLWRPWLYHVQCAEELLHPPVCMTELAPTCNLAMVINGEQHGSGKSVEERVPEVKEKPKSKRKPRNQRARK
jgi:hypothetical protein